MGKRIRKNIYVPEDNEQLFLEKAEKLGMDFNSLVNLLIAGVISKEEYDRTMKVVSEVSSVRVNTEK